MSGYIEINWSSGSIDEARFVCRYLVQERLVASAQIIPWIESISLWDNQLETAQETKVILKTKEDSFNLIKDVILKNCKFDIPEITSTQISHINEAYQRWLEESLVKKQEN